MRKIERIFLIFLLISLIISCYPSKKKLEEEGNKQFEKLLYELRNNFNLTIDASDYMVEHGGTISYTFVSKEYYIIRKIEKHKYKSKYFSDFENEFVYISSSYDTYGFRFKEVPEKELSSEGKSILISDRSRTMFKILSLYGLKPYVLNELLYDKSKGNDFSEIEKIFDKNGKIKIKGNMENGWSCNELKEAEIFMTTIDNCELKYKNDEMMYDNYEKIQKYDSLFRKYFSQERKLETIDWYDFLKFNNITPILIFEFSPESTDDEMRKVRDEIVRHYNKKEILIKLYKEKTGTEKGKGDYIW